MKKYYVYIMTNKPNGTLYIGVTNSIYFRTYTHKHLPTKSKFCKKYNLNKLVYFEEFDDVGYAIQREKKLKRWRRQWKIKLIEEMNPGWQDLYESFTG